MAKADESHSLRQFLPVDCLSDSARTSGLEARRAAVEFSLRKSDYRQSPMRDATVLAAAGTRVFVEAAHETNRIHSGVPGGACCRRGARCPVRFVDSGCDRKR